MDTQRRRVPRVDSTLIKRSIFIKLITGHGVVLIRFRGQTVGPVFRLIGAILFLTTQ